MKKDAEGNCYISINGSPIRVIISKWVEVENPVLVVNNYHPDIYERFTDDNELEIKFSDLKVELATIKDKSDRINFKLHSIPMWIRKIFKAN